jgi:aspartyl-tRNA(Asn)/glutamyl-tRNA(Gln) amidotransferase subunit C
LYFAFCNSFSVLTVFSVANDAEPIMSISRREVEKVALLARLQLTEAELGTMTEELGQIVGYVDLLSEVGTDGVEPMAHAIELANVFQDDHVADSLPRGEALAAAPHHDERGYLVPAALGE